MGCILNNMNDTDSTTIITFANVTHGGKIHRVCNGRAYCLSENMAPRMQKPFAEVDISSLSTDPSITYTAEFHKARFKKMAELEAAAIVASGVNINMLCKKCCGDIIAAI
jgi:hypothetical protein